MATTTVEPALTTHTRAMVLRRFGGVDGLSLETMPMPTPGPGQIRVRTLAASVQFTDVIIRRGAYPDVRETPPFALGYDVVGEVEAIGPGVEGIAIGDRVADMTVIGSYAHHRLLEAKDVVPVPNEVDPAEAATLVLSWMTAYQLMHRFAKVKAGDTVLIQGAAGAVGQALLALGKLAGLTMYGTCRSEHADLVESYGAVAIDYRTEHPADVIEGGADVVFDGIAQDGFRRSWRAVNEGGLLAAFGLSAAVSAGYGPLRTALWYLRPMLWNLLPNGKRAGFYKITGLRRRQPQWFREDLATLFGLLAAGRIRPRVAERIGLQDIPRAHARLEAGSLDGKIVLVP